MLKHIRQINDRFFTISTIEMPPHFDWKFETAIWETDSVGKILGEEKPIFLRQFNSRDDAISAHHKILARWSKELNNRDKKLN